MGSNTMEMLTIKELGGLTGDERRVLCREIVTH